MTIPDFSQVLRIHQELAPHLQRWIGEQPATKFASDLFARSERMRPAVMIFGVYNAGKSTLLNALLGKIEASMADRPETECVTAYEWNGFNLLDTPGIDAPPEHEQVSREQLGRCELVLFMVATGGVSNEAQTWRELVQLLQRKRRVMLIVNNKDGIEPMSDDFFRLANYLRDCLEMHASEAGIEGAGQMVSIQLVNAKTALRGRLEDKPALVERSGILTLENHLGDFLRQSDGFTVLESCRHDLLRLIEQAERQLEEECGSRESKALSKFGQRVTQEQTRLQTAMNDELARVMVMLKGKLGQLVNDAAESANVQESMSRMESASGSLAEEVGQRLADVFREETSKSRQALANIGQMLEAQLQNADAALVIQMEPLADEARVLHPGMIAHGMQQIPVADLAEQGTLVALETGKEWLPELFKGIGHKTMERWAHNVGRSVGPLLHVALFAWTIYRAVQDGKKAHQALIRRTQALNDAVSDFVTNLQAEYVAILARKIDEVFAPTHTWLAAREEEMLRMSGEEAAGRRAFAQAKMKLTELRFGEG